ncbi:hypothetical protein CK222_22330 [Mesorhizobium sp. WSM3866]|uniref:hypothetical protein n=1 Tax=Mesorhizobium sp. WSM3866 TaxID=422271 RepID=UPI000BB04BB1|nr:hypothetical protein [Mesorhizobium sp. WSM3866]PBB41310.1 hypothetical protein CK222_22330 [Mesorhizobium sp. WSM3866]
MKRVAKRYVDPATDKTSAHYLTSAEELGAKEVERRLFRQAVNDFGVQTANLEALLKPANWLTARPSVEIHAYYNQLSNLIVAWHPGGGREQFAPNYISRVEHEFLIRPAEYRRPRGELMYVQEPFGCGGPAERSLLLGFAARYRELLTEIASHIVITTCIQLRVDAGGRSKGHRLDISKLKEYP